MHELHIMFSDAHITSMHNLRRIIEDQWPAIVVYEDGVMKDVTAHSCDDCSPDQHTYYTHQKKYIGRHREQSPATGISSP